MVPTLHSGHHMFGFHEQHSYLWSHSQPLITTDVCQVARAAWD